MSFNIYGEYTFNIPLQTMFLNKNITIKGNNMITQLGESFFMNRCLNDTFNPISDIVIGTGIDTPKKEDDRLGNETARSSVITSVDITNKQLILKTSFTAKEIKGTTEIGVITTNQSNEEVLISRDVFTENQINDTFLTGAIGQIEIEYIFQFSTSHLKNEWTQHESYSNIYYTYEPSTVTAVFENTTGNGYQKRLSITEVANNKATFYYDYNTQNLYVQTSRSNNPKNEELMIQTK